MTVRDDLEIYQLIYRSRSALAGSDASVESEVAAILDRSGSNNDRNGVTGALMFTASVFVQVLEGQSADVEGTFERICCDTRHMGVELMSFSSVPARTFGRWQMHRAYADSELERLFRQLSEAAAPEGSTVETIEKAVALMSKTSTSKASKARSSQ